MTKKIQFLLAYLLFANMGAFAQDRKGTISGSFQSDFQFYWEDKRINALPPPERIGMNNYLKLDYRLDKFTTGLRYEHYAPPLLGYPSNFRGTGIANRYLTYRNDELDVTAGNFYTQFGSGIALRAQEQRQLGIDNSIDGVMMKYDFQKKARLTGVVGKQRDGFEKSEGTVRGLDAEVYLHQIFSLDSTKLAGWHMTLGGSLVSRYQPYSGTLDNVPAQTELYAGRVNISKGDFTFYSEYVFKTNDPTAMNKYKVGNGTAAMVNVGYTIQNIAINLSAKRVENMDTRSDRRAIANRLWVNYIPANTTQHTYRLLTLYPYAVQTVGETAVQADITYNIKKETFLGGKYGMEIALNYALAHDADTTQFWAMGNRTYFQDANIEITKKFSPAFKMTAKYVYLQYDKDQIEGTTGFGLINSHTVVVDMRYKLNKKQSLRLELQHLGTNQDFGSWMMGMLEYSLAPKWFFYVFDEINYNGLRVGVPIHYYNGGFAFVKNANRFSLNVGRQRAGLVCVGGICRIVPASSGVTFSVTSSF